MREALQLTPHHLELIRAAADAYHRVLNTRAIIHQAEREARHD